MISCMVFDHHMAELAKHRMNDSWEVALAQKAATHPAWEAVCEHGASCPAGQGQATATGDDLLDYS